MSHYGPPSHSTPGYRDQPAARPALGYGAEWDAANAPGAQPQQQQQQQPFAQQPTARPMGGGSVQVSDDDDDDDYDYSNPTGETEKPRRQFKYSTANMPQTSNWKRYCCICCMFLIFIAIMILTSMLIQHLFFGDVSDNGPSIPDRLENETFPEDKMVIDQYCSAQALSLPGGEENCEQACQPRFAACCDPFNEGDLYNFTTEANEERDALLANWTALDVNGTFPNLTECSFDQEARGCTSYAKCQALSSLVDPAPANLFALCSFETLNRDPEACQELCQNVRCCFIETLDCRMDHFEMCLDYAPCQNLRTLTNVQQLEPAPIDLDQACYFQFPECFDVCKRAECCADPDSSCLQENFITCLTYSSCAEAVETTNITLPPQFSHVNKPENDLFEACKEVTTAAGLESVVFDRQECEALCEEVQCCWDAQPNNCFFQDPLGCLAWEQQCKSLFIYT